MPELLVSFIVPTLNEAERIGALLSSLKSENVELIVVDGGSKDDTVAIAEPLVNRVLHVARGRAGQMNAGAAVAAGRMLVFVHADSVITENCLMALIKSTLSDENQWGFYSLKLSGSDWRFRIIEWLINKRSRLTSVATGDQCLWVRRSLFERIGGYADIPLMEDIEICKQLRKIVRPCCILSPVITSSRRWQERGVVRTVLLMWWLRLAYFLGVSPVVLARQYYD